MNHKNKHLRVFYFSHSFMVVQALHMHNNLNIYSYITTKKRTRQRRFACFSNICLASLGQKMLHFDCILSNLLLDFNGTSLVNF